jgi:hypothetical protein
MMLPNLQPSQVVTEHQLVEHSEAFEAAISGRDRAALQVW